MSATTEVTVTIRGRHSFDFDIGHRGAGMGLGATLNGEPLLFTGDEGVRVLHESLREEGSEVEQQIIDLLVEEAVLSSAEVAYSNCQREGVDGCSADNNYRTIEFYENLSCYDFVREWTKEKNYWLSVRVAVVG